MNTNYINNPSYDTHYYIWKIHYSDHLNNIFMLINKNIDINSKEIYNNFCYLLYTKSSKYISLNI